MTQRIELFSKIWYKELNFFSIWLNFFFKIWLEEFNPSFYHDSKILLLFWKKSKNLTFMTHRLEPFFFLNIFFKKKKDSKNWAFFWTMTLKMFFFFWSTNATHGTDFFLQNDSQNWSFWIWLFFFDIEPFFLNSTQRIEISNTTQRNNFFSLICLKE